MTYQHPVEGTVGDVTLFLDKVFKNLHMAGIDVQEYELDHLCFRVSTSEAYEKSKAAFSKLATLLSEAEINGRPIATFKLHEPIRYHDRKILIVEIPSPRPGHQEREGLEHVEFVVPDYLEKFVLKYPKLRFDKKNMTNALNSDVRLAFDDCSVKFHSLSLEKVIAIENTHG